MPLAPLFRAVLNETSTLCRLLSLTSNMNALVCGWKCLNQLISTTKGCDLLPDGPLDLAKIVLEITSEAREGLELLGTLEEAKVINRDACYCMLLVLWDTTN